MKITLASIAIIVLSLVSVNISRAQTLGVGCIDGPIRQQSLDMKKEWVAQGFTPVRDAMVGVESKKPFSMPMTLKKGVFYQIIFIGNALAQSITLEMFDDTGLRLTEKTVKRADNDPNYISISFTPEYTGNYTFALSQKIKSKVSCSAFLLMELKK